MNKDNKILQVRSTSIILLIWFKHIWLAIKNRVILSPLAGLSIYRWCTDEAAQKGHCWQIKNQKHLDLTINLWTASKNLIFSSKHKFWFPKRICSKITALSEGVNDHNNSSVIFFLRARKEKEWSVFIWIIAGTRWVVSNMQVLC